MIIAWPLLPLVLTRTSERHRLNSAGLSYTDVELAIQSFNILLLHEREFSSYFRKFCSNDEGKDCAHQNGYELILPIRSLMGLSDLHKSLTEGNRIQKCVTIQTCYLVIKEGKHQRMHRVPQPLLKVMLSAQA